jgi:endoglucanase
MNRRNFLKGLAVFGVSSRLSAAAAAAADVNPRTIPRWRGFNLQAMISPPGGPYDEFDFATMAGWGFDFARLPLSYWTWGSRDDWSVIREEPLKHIDRAVELGRQYGVHINLSFHRAPGYCINERDLEPADLFAGPPEEQARALRAAVFHWQTFARRYKGVPNSRLSFDLINEPPKMKTPDPRLEARYVEIVGALVRGIREADPGRLIFADGLDIGQKPVLGIVNLNLVQSTRGYLPKAVSHYTANWVPKDEFESFKTPTWPLRDDRGGLWDRARLRRELVGTYRPLLRSGVRVHVGEWGCFNKTPHAVALAWMEDCLSVWKEVGWGNALWNLRGSFGVLDSGRADVSYEEFKGHKLDRRMLELLRRY